MTSNEVTRRTAIRLIGGSAAAAALAYTLGTTADAAASPSSESASSAPFGAVGTVLAASADRLVVSTHDETIQVLRGDRTRAYAGVAGRVADLAAFVPGDRVFVEGARSSAAGGVVRASAVSSVFQPVRLKVTGLDQSGHAMTTLGRVDLRGHLPDLRNAGSLNVGAVVSGYTWSDPASGETYLLVPDH